MILPKRTWRDCMFASQSRKSKKREHFLEHISWQWFEHDTVSIDLRVIANTLDNRQIAANGQFTTDSLQRSATLMTLSQTSGQVTVPRVRVGITVFCIIALPRDRLGITAREVNVVCLNWMLNCCICWPTGKCDNVQIHYIVECYRVSTIHPPLSSKELTNVMYQFAKCYMNKIISSLSSQRAIWKV